MSETPETPIKTLGKYQIRGELGKGAMGVVYLGFDPALEREVAIKVMGGATVSDPDLKKRFEVEAKASAKLQHPNIVTVYDFGYDEQGAPYMAMEYLKGQDLEQRIRRNPLTFREKLEVLAQTCRGLAHAHKNGIVHRDIKPANIFISESGEAKIMDFGVARLQQSSHTQTGAVLGTADYMSPEQIRGAKVDGRSDIFSAGVILYRLLTNKKPFSGENIQAVFFKVLNQEPPELVLPDSNQMPELQAIVDKALSKAADDRYGSADDLADDISDLINLYHDVLNEDTVFDTMFDPSATPDSEMGTGSDGTGRRRTSGTGRVLGATSSGSRTHRLGTAYPTSGTGRTGTGMTRAGRTVAGQTTMSSPTRMMRGTQVGTMTGTRVGVGIPVQESGGWGKYVALVVLLLAVGGGVFWFTQQGPRAGATTGVNAATQPTLDVASQLALAQRSFDAGQWSSALQAVDAILFVEPANAEALVMKERVGQAIDAMKAPAPTTAPSLQAPPGPRGPSNSERVAALTADASLAIGAGDLARAEQLIREGRQIDPKSPRWQQLDQQLARSRSQSQQEAAREQQQAQIDALVGRATEHLKAQNYVEAIAAYDQALELDPNNARLIFDRNTAQNAMQQVAAAATVSALAIRQTKTEFIRPGDSDVPKGFESGGGVQVNRATSAPDNPAELIVEIHPKTVQPGDPYYLRVRVHNQGNRPVGVKSIELVSTFGSRTTGKGQQLTPMVQRVNPRDTSLIWEVPGTWSEDQNTGSIQAIVTLIGDAKLVKTIQWE
jgi:serine/threonine protein kinase